MNAAGAAAHFKSSFSPQFNGLMQPFGAEDALYAGYAPPTYNSWAGKVPSPLAGTAKSFPWGLNSVNMSPLTSVGMSGQGGISSINSIGCFNPAPGPMNTMPTVAMSNSLGMTSQTGPCHYAAPSNPYYREQCPPPPSVVGSAAMAGLSSLRLKNTAKPATSSSAGLISYAPVSPRSAPGLTACQYAAVDRSPI